jgi:outer membrane protein TolC
MSFWVLCRRIVVPLWASVVLIHVAPTLQAQAPASPTEGNTNNVYPIDLPTALRLANAQNLDIQIAQEKLAEARANNESATWQFFPWLGAGVGWRRHDNLIQNVEGKIIDAHKESYSVGPTFTAQVDLGDALFKKLGARRLVKAADFALVAQRQESVLAAAQGYFDLLRAQGAVGVAQEAIRISTNFAEQVQQAVGIGVAFKGDLLRVQVQTERYLLTLRQTQEQHRLASARLAQTLHLDPVIELVPQDADLVPLSLFQTNATLDALIAQALNVRPELKQSQAQIEAARQARQGALYGPLIPSLGAQVFAGGLGGGRDGDAGRFGESEDYQLALGWRLGPGGLFDQGRIHASRSRLHIAKLTGDKLMDEIRRQVVEGNARVQSLADQLATARRAVQAAEETLRLSQERKEFGVGVVLEAIQAEQELTRARLDYLNALAEHNKAQYQLSKAVGVMPASEP